MALNFNIPMPDIQNSFNVDSLIKQMMDRQKMNKEAELEQAKQKQLENHFQEQLKLSKGAAGRASQAAADAHRIAMNKLDPNYEINQIKKLYELGTMTQDGNQGTNTPQNNDMLRQKLQAMGVFGQNNELPQGQGAIPMQAQEEVPKYPVEENTPNNQQITNQPNLMQMIVGGMLKKKTGTNPFAKNEGVLHGPARDVADLERFKNMLPGGENNPLYQQAFQAYNAKMQGQKDLSAVRGRTLGGLKTGERWLTDQQTGETIGKEIPLSATERTEYKGRGFFNYTFPLISGGLSPLSGKNSINKLTDAASKYEKDPSSTKLIDDFILAKKLLTAGTVKEAATLATGKQKATYEQLRESLDSSDIPKRIESIIKQFGLPSSAAQKADKRFSKILNDATKAGEHSVPAFQKQYFDPNKQNQESVNKNSSKYNDSDLVVVEGPNGDEVMTYAKAKSLGAM